MLEKGKFKRIKYYRTTELSKAARYQQWGLLLPIVKNQESDPKDSKWLSRQRGVPATKPLTGGWAQLSLEKVSHAFQYKA